ncbi:MAG: hypothetical protein ACYS9V_03895 [Planctomycetota bacterium]|jgi:hypothetical protein
MFQLKGRDKSYVFFLVVTLLIVFLTAGSSFGGEKDFAAGSKQEKLVKASIKFIKDNEGKNKTGADEELEKMRKTKAKDGKKQLREDTDIDLANAWTNSTGIGVGLPAGGKINSDITTKEGFRQVKTLAETLYHEWVHWKYRKTKDGLAYYYSCKNNWTKCQPRWDEVEAYYKEIQLKLQWKVARENALAKIPGFGPAGPPTPAQLKEAQRLQREIAELEKQIDDLVDRYIEALRKVTGTLKKNYEGHKKKKHKDSLKKAFTGKTNKQKLKEVNDRLKDVSKVDKREKKKSMATKIREKIKEYKAAVKKKAKKVITPPGKSKRSVITTIGEFEYSLVLDVPEYGVYDETEIILSILKPVFLEPWEEWGNHFLSPAFTINIMNDGMFNPRFPSTVTLSYNPGLIGERPFYLYRMINEDDGPDLLEDGERWQQVADQVTDFGLCTITASVPDPEGMYVVMEEEVEYYEVSNASVSDEDEHVRTDASLCFQAAENALCMDLSAEPNMVGPFSYDVYVGTEPNKATMTLIVSDYQPVECNEVMCFEPNPVEDLMPATQYLWSVDIYDFNTGGDPCFYEGPIFSFTTWGYAINPIPWDGAESVHPNDVLFWDNDGYADSFKLFFGDDEETVSLEEIPTEILAAGEEVIGWNLPEDVNLGQTHFWRIDECNDSNCVPGDVWSFTTSFCDNIDDFEDYTSDSDLRENWVAYPDDPLNGGQVFLETTNVYEGEQAMAFVVSRDQTEGNYANAERQFSPFIDLNVSGETSINIAYGVDEFNPPDPCTDSLYLEIEDGSGNFARFDVDDSVGEEVYWSDFIIFSIDLGEVAVQGVDINEIEFIRIGAETTDSSATIFITYWDLLKTCVPFCRPEFAPIGDFTGPDGGPDCFVDEWDLERLKDEWLSKDELISPVAPCDVNLLVEYLFDNNDLSDSSGGGFDGIAVNDVSFDNGVLVLMNGNDVNESNAVDIPFIENPFAGDSSFTVAMDYKSSGPNQPGILLSSARDIVY